MADAIDLLVTHADFQASDIARIHTGTLPLFKAQPLVQLCVQFQDLRKSTIFVVWLPSSTHFKAKPLDRSGACNLNTANLNNATVDFNCKVTLAAGEQMNAVEIIPSVLPYELSDLEWQILECTIKYLKIEDLVVRIFGEELAPEIQETLPKICGIDFQRLKGFEVPHLKVLRQVLVENGVGNLSLEKISNTMSKCGMRPVARRRPTRSRPQPGPDSASRSARPKDRR